MRSVVVDPSRTVLKAVSNLLESEGHAVTTFINSEEALDFIKSEREVSVLITSVELSPMSGIELCWKTRRLSGCERTIYIILMSSTSEEQQLSGLLRPASAAQAPSPPPQAARGLARQRCFNFCSVDSAVHPRQ